MESMGKKKLTRRDVLKATGAALPAGILGSSVLTHRESNAEGVRLPSRTLGRTGVRLSTLTLGCGHLREQFVSQSEVSAIVGRALEMGVTSIDTAPNYDESEKFLGNALKGKRNHAFLATKTEDPTFGGCLSQIEQSLQRLQTDYLDLVYIHNIGLESRFPDIDACLSQDGALGALLEAKKRGLVRYLGVSGHVYPGRWAKVQTLDEFDVYMCAVNHVAKHQYDFETKVFAEGKNRNLGLIAMKVLGGPADWKSGTARFAGEQVELAIRYALDLPGVCSANIGVRNVAELEEAAVVATTCKPLTSQERKTLSETGKQLAQSWEPLYGTPVT